MWIEVWVPLIVRETLFWQCQACSNRDGYMHARFLLHSLIATGLLSITKVLFFIFLIVYNIVFLKTCRQCIFSGFCVASVCKLGDIINPAFQSPG